MTKLVSCLAPILPHYIILHKGSMGLLIMKRRLYSGESKIYKITRCTKGEFFTQTREGGGTSWVCSIIMMFTLEMLKGGGGGRSCVGFYKCFSLIVGFAIIIAIWPRKVVSCRDFILRTVATFWAMSLVGIYPGRGLTNDFFAGKNSW